jgi:hypothetical protein
VALKTRTGDWVVTTDSKTTDSKHVGANGTSSQALVKRALATACQCVTSRASAWAMQAARGFEPR